jgi:hypothetical protein
MRVVNDSRHQEQTGEREKAINSHGVASPTARRAVRTNDEIEKTSGILRVSRSPVLLFVLSQRRQRDSEGCRNYA